ncbi:MAG: mismatch-specific DNA-glycosylase [Anaerolineales bacterium]|nr:mismatch-specific DNA-glycosylase [Anaerolineales bacterium]
MTVLPDFLAPNLDIVFCGTAVSNVSAQRGAYYAGPGNMFWPTLYEIGLTPRRLQPKEFREVLSFGLGLTDLVKAVSGVDTQLRDEHFDRERLRATILRYAPKILAFTSKRAGSEFLDRPVKYGLQPEKVGSTALFVLPSPSGAARRWWDVRQWQELARLREQMSLLQITDMG